MSAIEQSKYKEFDLGGVVPWGRRLSEYRLFFALGDDLPRQRILDAGGGPSSFATEATALGACVVAADPIYEFAEADIAAGFEDTAKAMREGMHRAAYRFNWTYYGSEDEVHRLRRQALELFLADFEAGKAAGRYVTASLPQLPFADRSFDLALSSHLLFLYGDDLDLGFHIEALRELLRVAAEVRVFPLINLDGRPSSHLPGAIRALSADGVKADIVPVPFEFQLGASKMLRLERG